MFLCHPHHREPHGDTLSFEHVFLDFSIGFISLACGKLPDLRPGLLSFFVLEKEFQYLTKLRNEKEMSQNSSRLSIAAKHLP